MAWIGHVFVPPSPTSERARRLSAELQKTVADFQRREPSISGRDVRQALFMTMRVLDAGRRVRMAATAMGVGVALVLGMLLTLRDTPNPRIPWVPLAVLAVAGAVALTLYLRRRE